MEHKPAFVLAGFSQDYEFRVFEFTCVDEDRTRKKYTVRVDLTLARKCGIHIQELPLLCRRFLDGSERGCSAALTLPEEEMIACAAKEALRNQAKARKPWQRPADAEEKADAATGVRS